MTVAITVGTGSMMLAIGTSVRAGMAQFLSYLSGLEMQFTGRMPNEIVLDPIANYVEWSLPSRT